MNRLYTMSCKCVYHSSRGYTHECPGKAYQGTPPNKLSSVELRLLNKHETSTTTIEGVVL
jgi:hypothetical protein